jgi:hypothetical protein
MSIMTTNYDPHSDISRNIMDTWVCLVCRRVFDCDFMTYEEARQKQVTDQFCINCMIRGFNPDTIDRRSVGNVIRCDR